MEKKNFERPSGGENETVVESTKYTAEVNTDGNKVTLCSHSSTENTLEATHSMSSSNEIKQDCDNFCGDIQKEDTNPCSERLKFADELLTNIMEANEGHDYEILKTFERIKNSEDDQSEKVQSILKIILSMNKPGTENFNPNWTMHAFTMIQLQKVRNSLSIEEKTNVRDSKVWKHLHMLSDHISYLIAVTNTSGNSARESTFKNLADSIMKNLQKTVAVVDRVKASADDIQEARRMYQILTEEIKAAFQVTTVSELAEETNNIMNEYQKSKKKLKTSAGSSDDVRVANNTIQNKTKQEKALDEKSRIELESKDKSDIHTLHSVEEVTLGKQKCDPEAKTASLEKGSSCGFYNGCSLDPKKILKPKSFELEKDLKSYRSKLTELDLKEDLRDLISVEKEAVLSEPCEPKSESCEEFGLTGNLEKKTNKAKSSIKSDTELIKVNEKDNSMDFQIEYDGKKYIFIGKERFSYSAEEKPMFILGDSVQVQLTTDQISVLTPNSEFVISIRKPNIVSLNDKNTQT